MKKLNIVSLILVVVIFVLYCPSYRQLVTDEHEIEREYGIVREEEQEKLEYIDEYEDGRHKIIKKGTGELIYSLDYRDLGIEKGDGAYQVHYTTSKTGRYTFIAADNQVPVVFDADKKSFFDLPIFFAISAEWSPNDEMVIIFQNPNYDTTYELIDGNKAECVYIWDLKDNSTQKIHVPVNAWLRWTPDGKSIYYVARVSREDRLSSVVMVYDTEKKSWIEAYSTYADIDEPSIEWVSNYEFVLVEKKELFAPLSLLAMTEIQGASAVKTHMKEKKTKKIRLYGIHIDNFRWSHDHKYVYFTYNPNVDVNEKYRTAVNF